MNEYPCEDTCTSVFFFKGIFVRSQKGYHPEEDVETIGYNFQEDLAKYCYKIKAGRGKKKFLIMLLYFGYTLKTKHVNLAIENLQNHLILVSCFKISLGKI